jgi:hypothetical protein
MNSIKHKRAFLTTLAILTVTASALVSTPSAYASCELGKTCFLDYESNQWGQVEFDNKNWTAFGWNDRADYFYNNGRTHNICLHQHANEDPRGWGERRIVTRGQSLYWPNIVSSNRWTQESDCYQYRFHQYRSFK